MKIFNVQKGISLAEILIAMTVIGITLSVVVPSLVADVQDKHLKAAWREEMKNITLATKKLLYSNKGNLTNKFASAIELKDAYKRFLNISRDCDNALTEKCSTKYYHKLNGSNWNYLNDHAGFLLTNGALIVFNKTAFSSDCSKNDSTFITNRCGAIHIDVNGNAPPNVSGKDIFGLHLFKNRILPQGCKGDPDCNDYWSPSLSCNPGSTASTNTGGGCAAKYLME